MKKTNQQKTNPKTNKPHAGYAIPAGNGAVNGHSNSTTNANATGVPVITESDIPAVTDLTRIISQHCRTHRLSVMRLLHTFDPQLQSLQAVLRTFRREQVEAALALLSDWESEHNSVVDERIFIPIVIVDDGSPRLVVITNIGDPIELGEVE